MTKKAGTDQTRHFYEREGWRVENGEVVDRKLFGVKEDGPIRVELHRLHIERISRALSTAGFRLNLLECGCGGNPERNILSLCERYTGVDFSESGIEVARSSLSDLSIPVEFRVADICDLPFEDGAFDAVYCAHVIYHIIDPASQEAALAELIRVVRPGGVVVLVAANPHPVAFPIRLALRLVADAPIIGAALNRVRSAPPVPYNPRPIRWMRARLERGGMVDVLSAGIPSTWFYQNVTELRGVGRLMWKLVRWADRRLPRLSAYLGNYVMLVCKRDVSPIGH